ncbi:MAG: arabinogalactan endo-1,4-beta-galactosidase [Rudaea sp.]
MRARLGSAGRLACALLAALLAADSAGAREFYLGADLSYVNEMEDCGATYREQGIAKDAFALFKEHGANLVRVRLWNDAAWTRYSDLSDVRKTIRRAKAQGMQVLLDFHYSDDWADGDKQIIPKAWEDIDGIDDLARALHDFTYDTLTELDRAGLMPELVQVGNETNVEMLGRKKPAKNAPIDWTRNARLLNAGIRAVREAGAASNIKPRVMLHVAQPENVEPWFAAAAKAGVTDFDLIGISYYHRWSTRTIAQLGETIARLRQTYRADVIVAETAYPWTLGSADAMPNLLGKSSVIAEYPPTPEGQLRYLVDLTHTVVDSGGSGVVYWEPAWVTSRCATRWGRGSAWENATFFDFSHRNELLPGIDFMRQDYAGRPK